MNRKFKRFLSAILAVVMVLSAVPVISYATDSDDYCSYKVGDIIEFGSYPQSVVTDPKTIDELNKIEPITDNIPIYYGESYTVYYNGEKYRKLTNAYSSVYEKSTHYFKFEPIKWRVLDVDTGLLMSINALDSHEFKVDLYGSGMYVNPECTELVSYESSDIRKWLNNTFDKVAFTEEEYNKIVNKVIDDTRYDKSYIPTLEEVTCVDYGFSNDMNFPDPARVAYSTDYLLFFWGESGKVPSAWMINHIYDNLKNYRYIRAEGFINTPILSDCNFDMGCQIRPFIQIGQLKSTKKHIPSDWITTKESTYTEDGEKCKYCKNCNKILESEVIPKLKTGINSIELPYDVLEVKHRDSITLKPTVDCEQNYTLSYSSSDEEVLTVDENGKITTHSRGTATVTCTATDEDGKTLTDTCEVTVKYNFWQWIVRIFLFIIGINSRI